LAEYNKNRWHIYYKREFLESERSLGIADEYNDQNTIIPA